MYTKPHESHTRSHLVTRSRLVLVGGIDLCCVLRLIMEGPLPAQTHTPLLFQPEHNVSMTFIMNSLHAECFKSDL